MNNRMKNITMKNVADVCGGTCYGPETLLNLEVSSIWTDSRRVEEGSLFIPLKGERTDGHVYIEQVFEKGALFTLSEHMLQGDNPYVLVKSTYQALKDIAQFYLEQLKIPVVGITGSVGKTSTKEMVASVLSQKFCTLKTDGNFNNEVGLPLTVFRLREEHQAAVLEMGISQFGEMLRLTRIVKPDIAVITNIGLCHLENLKNRDGVLKAKTEIFEGLKENGAIILNGNDDKLCTVKEYRGIRPLFYGDGGACGIYVDEVESLGLKGTKCCMHTPAGSFRTRIPVPGFHMVQNAMAACGVGLKMGLKLQEIQRGIETLKPVDGRDKLIETGRFTILDSCYNANPTSMEAVIDLLCYAPGRKVCILGDMFELGEEEKELHKKIGYYLSEKKIDVLIAVGQLGRYIADAANERGLDVCWHFAEKQEAMENCKAILKDGDFILVKASHSMGFSDIVSFLQNA